MVKKPSNGKNVVSLGAVRRGQEELSNIFNAEVKSVEVSSYYPGNHVIEVLPFGVDRAYSEFLYLEADVLAASGRTEIKVGDKITYRVKNEKSPDPIIPNIISYLRFP